jgi:hypothetical protein
MCPLRLGRFVTQPRENPKREELSRGSSRGRMPRLTGDIGWVAACSLVRAKGQPRAYVKRSVLLKKGLSASDVFSKLFAKQHKFAFIS